MDYTAENFIVDVSTTLTGILPEEWEVETSIVLGNAPQARLVQPNGEPLTGFRMVGDLSPTDDEALLERLGAR
jgi:hypothetical protein